MISWEILPNGIRKHFDWGYSEIYAEPENCFTKQELIQVVKELDALKGIGATTPKTNALLVKLKEKLKEKPL